MITRIRWLLPALFLFVAAASAQVPAELSGEVRIHDLKDLAKWRPAGAKAGDEGLVADIVATLRAALGLNDASRIEAEIVARNDSIVVYAQAETQRKIEGFLTDLRLRAEDIYHLQMRFVVMPKGTAASKGLLAGGVESGPVTVVLADDERNATILASGDQLSAPHVLTQAFGNCSISMGKQRRFVTAWEKAENVEDFADGLLVPKVESVFEGLEISVRLLPHQVVEEERVRLDLRVQSSWVDGGVRRESTEHGIVHRYEAATREVACALSLQPGARFAIGPLPAVTVAGPGNDDRETILIATLEAADADGKKTGPATGVGGSIRVRSTEKPDDGAAGGK